MEKKEYKDSPYKEIPAELLNGYTMNGKIGINKHYRDDTNALAQKEWDEKYVNSFKDRFTIEKINDGTQGREPYPGAAKLLLKSFQKYNIKNKKVAVIGSATPWIETILLNLGNTTTTVEYNVPNPSYEGMSAMSYWEFLESNNKFDFIVTYSSIEHAGLGRYGDPLNPDEDIVAMNQIKERLSEGGLLFWGAPVGKDRLWWNIHRIYGTIRLPLLFDGLEEIEWFGGIKEHILQSNGGLQPVIVLKHNK